MIVGLFAVTLGALSIAAIIGCGKGSDPAFGNKGTSRAAKGDDIVLLLESLTLTGDCVNHAHQMRRHFLRYLMCPNENLSEAFDEELESTAAIIESIRKIPLIEDNKKEAEKLATLLQQIKADKNVFIEQETVTANLREASSVSSSSVRDGLRTIAEELCEKHMASDIVVFGLEMEFYRAKTCVYHILHCRDVFVFSTIPEIGQIYKRGMFDAMEELATRLDEIKAHPALPVDLTDRFDTAMEDYAKWKEVTAEYVNAIMKQREMQEPLLAYIRHVIAGANEMQERVYEECESRWLQGSRAARR